MKTIDHIIDRLEIRRMSVSGLQCLWCTACLRVSTSDPAARGSFECIWPGDQDCRQPLSDGPISTCIDELKELAAEAA